MCVEGGGRNPRMKVSAKSRSHDGCKRAKERDQENVYKNSHFWSLPYCTVPLHTESTRVQ